METEVNINRLVLRYTLILLLLLFVLLPFAASDGNKQISDHHQEIPSEIIATILDQSVPAVATDWIGNVVFANPTALAKLQHEEIRGLHISQWLSQRDAETADDVMRMAKEGSTNIDCHCTVGLNLGDGECITRVHVKSYESRKGDRVYIVSQVPKLGSGQWPGQRQEATSAD